jgi:acetyltransferase-like isoleucine patch superfamily enzyme
MSDEISASLREIAPDVKIGKGVRIEGDKVTIGPGSVIGDDVAIFAKEVDIGHKAVIQERCSFKAIGGRADLIRLGDYSLVGFDTRVLVPVFSIGDYTAVHNHVLVNGYKPCRLGHNGFVGQHSVLNSTADLEIGNNFRMALNGYIWTHAESGELLEGCNFYHQTPTVIEDNVWLTGCNISISPGVRLAEGSIILMGSVVVGDTERRHCYSGVPARDVTEKLKPYREVGLDEKAAMMKGFVREFDELNGMKYSGSFAFVQDPDSVPENSGAEIVIIERGAPIPLGEGVSVFSLSEKTYLKQRTEIEERFMRFLIGARARFLPVQ